MRAQRRLAALMGVAMVASLMLSVVAAGSASAGERQRTQRVADRDGDGMPNRWERAHDLRPGRPNAKGDPDDDGLRNIAEFRHHTRPHGPDSDQDGLVDGLEIHRFGTHPRWEDTDDDGVDDGEDDGNDNGIPDEGEDGDDDGFVGVIYSFKDHRLVFQSAMGWPVSVYVNGDTQIEFVDCSFSCGEGELREGQNILAMRLEPELYKGVPVVASMTVSCDKWD